MWGRNLAKWTPVAVAFSVASNISCTSASVGTQPIRMNEIKSFCL